MRRTALATIMLSSLFYLAGSGCGSKESGPAVAPPGPEMPRDAVARIIELLKKKDFATLIKERCADVAGSQNETRIKALVSEYQRTYADKTKLEDLVMFYESLLAYDPGISEDDKTAVYNVENKTIKFTRMANGKWGFHQ